VEFLKHQNNALEMGLTGIIVVSVSDLQIPISVEVYKGDIREKQDNTFKGLYKERKSQ
jgi:phage tail sheath gpL-like